MRTASILFLALAWTLSLLAGEAPGPARVQVILSDGQTLTADHQAGKPVDVTTKEGLRLIGVDLSWYAPVAPSGEKPAPLSDDDRKEIREICTVPSFYDRCEILLLQGDADHAVGLMQLVRDRDFHAGKGEVIWRAELWYFEFQNGGWAKVSQQNRVLDRQRFASPQQYLAYVRPIRFVPKLGRPPEGASPITLTAADLVPAAGPQAK